MKWGLVPHYSKFEDKNLNTTNARAENLAGDGGMWASLKGPKRCAVVCQGYYEWLTKGKSKLPHFVKPKDGRLMLMAGRNGNDVDVHDRHHRCEPRVLVATRAAARHPAHPEALAAWLDTSSLKWSSDLVPLLAPTTCALDCYQVPKEVGKVGTESSTFIEPVENRKDGIQALFNKQKQRRRHRPRRR
ncbi:hypothetical protein B0H14DRAFT_2616802 [Mycena olivaceomarginata]|nr:hypothetical protein B0H14DRAFT_2616802 [Mycena olivaceomarginata]